MKLGEMWTPIVWHIGGEDVRMRIPILLSLRAMGFGVAAVGSEDSKPFDRQGIEYHRYHLERGIAPIGDMVSRRQLTALFRERRPDVVHAFDTKPGMLVPAAGKIAGVKCTLRTVTGMGYVFSTRAPVALALRPIYRYMQKQASRLADATIFQNTDDQTYFESTGLIERDRSILVKSSGVDINALMSKRVSAEEQIGLRSELGLGAGPVVTMIARLVKYKGVLEFLEAARRVKRSMPECHFLLVGPQASEGGQAVPKAVVDSYRDAVNWLGPRSDVPALLSLTDVFVLPSYYREGVPRVLLEAGAMGIPLVTTDMPGCRDVVRNGREGLLVQPRDVGSLVQAIVTLAGNPLMRMDLGARAKAHVEESFTLDKVASAYASVYRDLLNRHC